MRAVIYVIAFFAVAAATAQTSPVATEPQKGWTFGIRPSGGGFFIISADGRLELRLLGYAQVVGTVVNGDFQNSFGSTDIRIRRARVGWGMLFDKKYDLFIEYDGVPQTGNLNEARLNWRMRGDDAQLRVGKFIVPFSEEGWRSARNYDTVERFIVLNSLYALPALDTQIGMMVHGQVLENDRLSYYLGAWNGNASLSETSRDNNDDKEYQAKVTCRITHSLRFGLGLDHATEESQTLRLNSLTGTPFAAVGISGVRQGIDGDFFYQRDELELRGEWMHIRFSDAGTTLSGGFLQVGYFTNGNQGGGFQPLLRVETARMVDERAPRNGRYRVDAVTLGFNWYLSDNVRLQFNAIGENFSDEGIRVLRQGFAPSLLTELQMRF